MEMDGIRLIYEMVIPHPDTTSLLPFKPKQGSQGQSDRGAGYWLAALPIAGVCAGRLKGRRNAIFLLVLIAFGLSLSTGCDLGFGIYGVLKGEYAFPKLAYADENFNFDRVEPQIWKLTEGKGVMDCDITIMFYDKDDISEENCIAQLEVYAKGLIVKDGAITEKDIK